LFTFAHAESDLCSFCSRQRGGVPHHSNIDSEGLGTSRKVKKTSFQKGGGTEPHPASIRQDQKKGPSIRQVQKKAHARKKRKKGSTAPASPTVFNNGKETPQGGGPRSGRHHPQPEARGDGKIPGGGPRPWPRNRQPNTGKGGGPQPQPGPKSKTGRRPNSKWKERKGVASTGGPDRRHGRGAQPRCSANVDGRTQATRQESSISRCIRRPSCSVLEGE
jgi:hypothetical protein